MKRSILLLFIAVSAFTLQAQTLKGITLGKTTDEDQITTTVAGINGVIAPGKINDGRVYTILFIPSDDGLHVSRVYLTDLKRLVTGLEKKYNIKLKKHVDYSTGEITSYHTSDYKYFINVDYNQFMTPGYKISLSITDDNLREIHEQEKQNQANNDF